MSLTPKSEAVEPTPQDFLAQQFIDLLGPPNRTVGKERHWSVQPFARGVTINVVIDGTVRRPLVWLFDPHDSKESVVSMAIETQADAESVVRELKRRIQAAADLAGKLKPSVRDEP